MVKVFVHRFRWSHEAKRKKYRRLLKEGRVRILMRLKDGWLYEYVPEVKV